MTAPDQVPVVADMTAVREHLAAMWGNTVGFAYVEFKHVHTGQWTAKPFEWPARRKDLLAEVRRRAPDHNCFYCPNIMREGGRCKGNAARRPWVWLDQDRPVVDAALFERFPPTRTVDSGSDGHTHRFWRVDVDSHESHQQICWGIGRTVGCGNDKIADNDLFRIPGTFNFKHDSPVLVRVVERNERRHLEKRLRAAVSADDYIVSDTASVHVPDAEEPARAPSGQLSRSLNDQATGDASSRYKRTWRTVAECVEAGYTLPETLWLMREYVPGLDKFEGRYVGGLPLKIAQFYREKKEKDEMREKEGPPDRRTNDQVAPTTSDDALEDIAVDHNTMVDTKFWDSRDYLKRIYEAATNVGRSPWGVLGVVLSRVSCLISPEYVLPPITGSYGSLNVNVLITGKPGSGKNACFSLAKRLVADDIKVCAPASGEAVASVFATRKRTKEGVQTEYHTESAWMTIGEVTQVQAQIQRSGSTLLPTLLSAAMGELIGRDLADRPNGLLIQDHRYRLGVAIGVQPESLELLEKTGGQGLPQRYLWFPGREHGQKRASHEMPPPVATLGVEDSTTDMPDNLDKPRRADEFKIISLPEAVVREVIEFDEDDDKDPLDTHSMLLRLRVAACLMWMDGRKGAISPEDWELSASVMDVSRSTRNRVMGESYAAKQENKIRRLVADSDAVAEAKDRNFKATVEKVRSLVSERLSVGEEVTIRWFQMKVRASRMKDHTDDAVQTLVDKGVLRRSGTSYVRIR